MIITRTPYRISLFGGGTDHPKWFNQHRGAVVSFTINKYSYINLRILPPFFEHNFRVVYSKIELTKSADEIKHPAVKGAFLKFAPGLNIELHHHGDLPAQSGIGSSSAFSVGVIKSLLALTKKDVADINLANLAIDFEQNVLHENVGSQDQIACALGGINLIQFEPTNKWEHKKIDLSDEYISELEKRIVLVYSGIQRLSSDVTKTLLQDLYLKSEYMERTHELALECYDIFKNEKKLSLIGGMLNESWVLKQKSNASAVTAELEAFYYRGIESGAEGGKILGAGGGGFFLFWVNPNNRDSFIKKMSPKIVVSAEITNQGSVRIN
jgi:D-glycero-alpha-D-manno-heptose-7-phosphate kinase